MASDPTPVLSLNDAPEGVSDSAPAPPGVRADDVLERVADACVILDRQWRIVYANRRACEINRKPRAQFVGRTLWEEWPAAVGAEPERQYRRAVDAQVDVHFEHRYAADGYDVWLEVDAYPTGDGLSLFYRDVTDRKRAEAALRQSRDDLRLAVDAAEIGTFYCDYPLDKITWNDTCKRHFFLPPDAEVDFTLFYSLLHPDDRAPTRRAIERAQAERVEYDVEYRTQAPDGRTRWLNAVGRFYYDAGGNPVRFDGITRDITERAERGRRERLLGELAERARRLTDPDAVIADAVRSLGEFLGASRCLFADIDIADDVCTVRPDYRADDSVASMTGASPISDFGPYLVGEYGAGRTVVVEDVRADPARFPPAYAGAYEAVGVRAFVAVPVLHSARLVSVVSVHNAEPRDWRPTEVELLRTVVERTWLTVEVLRQQQALAREAEERREAHENTARILESVTDGFFTLDRAWRFTHVNAQAERMLRRTRGELLGRNVWEAFPEAEGGTFHRAYRRAMEDGAAVTVEDYSASLDSWLEVRVYPSESGLSVFFQSADERKRAEAERERLLAEQRARAEREALLNRIGEAIRGAADPEAVQEAAARLLGEALGADRCYVALYDLARGAVTVARDWRRAGLPALQGTYPFPNTAAMFAELYGDTSTSVIEDARAARLSAQTRANMEGLGLRSRVSVALADGGGLAATLTAAMADAPRAWTADEVALIEAAATQLRTAVEAARVTLREHTIAQQLQAALQPAVPAHVPGLALADYYRPALEEAGVGGDFSDVFAADKGATFLVVGDLSGKGLAAASEVAMVRHMLRFALYNSSPETGRTMAEPVGSLNDILAANGLLTGFSTLFVGRFEAGARTLTYVNCGQDAGLVLRAATGRVEALPPTGPVLGAFVGAEYAQRTVTLEAGDALALYTDGLTEAGPSRTALLTGDGVADLVRGLAGVRDPGEIVRRVMAGVDEYAGAGVRDDQCLLVGVVGG